MQCLFKFMVALHSTTMGDISFVALMGLVQSILVFSRGREHFNF
jgi:hypothetical protein